MRKTFLLIVALTAIGASAAPLAAQSLADVARQEEARRKEIKTPSKVLTNKDLSEVPPATAGATSSASSTTSSASSDTSSSTPATSASAAGGDAPKDGAVVKDQKYYSAKMRLLQDTLSRDQVLASAMQTQINSLTTDFVNRDDPAQRATIERNRTTALGELNRLKDQIKKDQKAIDDFQEDARRAGVPPGWLR